MPGMTIEPYVAIFNGNTISGMGAFTYTHSSIPMDFIVGRYCSIAWDVRFPGPRHPLELLTTAGFSLGAVDDLWAMFASDTGSELIPGLPNPQKVGTVIGNDVWIGEDAAILRGFTIGDGAVIAASSVITRDVPAFAIVGGNPARFIRWRFPEHVRRELADLAWWRYGTDVLGRIDLSNIETSIRELRAIIADIPPFEPPAIDLGAMPHGGLM
jgi:acetyltransferase-like isoleucine patch superfamily enzyme